MKSSKLITIIIAAGIGNLGSNLALESYRESRAAAMRTLELAAKSAEQGEQALKNQHAISKHAGGDLKTLGGKVDQLAGELAAIKANVDMLKTQKSTVAAPTPPTD